jgi:hypothetical protein
MSQQVSAPGAPAAVVLDIGAGVGALVLDVPTAWLGKEIEISPRARPGCRTHAVVRMHGSAAGAVHAAVFPQLLAGSYTVYGCEDARAVAEIEVRSGLVATVAVGRSSLP